MLNKDKQIPYTTVSYKQVYQKLYPPSWKEWNLWSNITPKSKIVFSKQLSQYNRKHQSKITSMLGFHIHFCCVIKICPWILDWCFLRDRSASKRNKVPHYVSSLLVILSCVKQSCTSPSYSNHQFFAEDKIIQRSTVLMRSITYRL